MYILVRGDKGVWIKYFICLLQPISHGECSNDNEKTFFANHANLVMEKMWYHTN